MTTTKTPVPPKMTRAAFVRSLPDDLSAEEVIERAKKFGIDVKSSDVHSARYYMRQEAEQESQLVLLQPKKLEEKKTPLPTFENVHPPIPDQDFERLVSIAADFSGLPREQHDYGPDKSFRAMVMRLGTDRAKRIIAEVEREYGIGSGMIVRL